MATKPMNGAQNGKRLDDGDFGLDRRERDLDDELPEDEGVESALLSHDHEPERVREMVEARELETNWQVVKGILVETVPTLLFTMVGMVFSGELLQRISEWPAFNRVDELLILVPVLDNLKGNVEMNLSARLSTAANTGQLDSRAMRRGLILGSLYLLQVQALVVSAVAAVVSFTLGRVLPRRNTVAIQPKSGFMEFMMVLTAAMSSASLSGAILGSFMCSLILLCRYLHRNPDNIAAPIAACLGDLLTMALLSLTSSLLIAYIRTVLPIVLAIILACLTAAAIWMTLRNAAVRSLLFEGWSPLFGAMIISTGAGMVLEGFVDRYEGFGMLAIVIGGLPGSIGSVFVCRLSTALHAADSSSLKRPSDAPPPERPLLVSATLLAVSLPVAIAYLVFVWAAGWMELPIVFVIFFTIFLCITSAISLLLAYGLTNLFWSRGLDPDTYCLPIQSSLVDLIGQTMLVVSYELARLAGANVAAT